MENFEVQAGTTFKRVTKDTIGNLPDFAAELLKLEGKVEDATSIGLQRITGPDKVKEVDNKQDATKQALRGLA
eukprot:9301590-Lingulodinium_polyedra.AAC.1